MARRYGFYVRLAKTISHEWAQRMGEILFLPREHKIHMFEPKYNVLIIIAQRLEFLEFLEFGQICKKLLEFFQVMLSSLHHICIFLLLSERFYVGFSELNFSIEGRTGVFSRRVISWFYFSWNVNLINLFFVTRDQKVLRETWRAWINNRYSWFHHFIDFILRDFETRDLKCDLRIIIVTSNTLCRVRIG